MKRYSAFILCLLLLLPCLAACKTDKTAIDIPQRIFLYDGKELYTQLYSMYMAEDKENIPAEADRIAESMKGWEYYGDNIGGAEYEGKIYESGDYIADSDDAFKSAVKRAKAGEVIFIPSGVTIDLSDLADTESFTAKLNEGVIVASDRGINEGGTLKFSHPAGTLLVCKSDCVVTGLNLCGVISPSGVSDPYKKDNGIRIDGTNVTVSNCEIASFSKSGITVFPDGQGVVTDCFIHHCANGIADRKYGLTLENNAFFENGTNYKNDSEDDTPLPKSNGILTASEKTESLIKTVYPDITSAVFPADSFEVYKMLLGIAEGNTDKIIDALAYHSGTTNYYYYKDSLSITKDGVQYGIRNDGTPLGGGKGYENIITGGDYTVTDTAALVTALKEAKAGEIIYIPEECKISVTGLAITVPEGVTVASNRGYVHEDGSVSTGGMLYTTTRQTEAIILSENCVFTGITFAGADTERHMTHLNRGLNEAGTSYTDYYYSLTLSRGIVVRGNNAEVSNCEISGFSEAGVLVEATTGVKVHHNYIHHNQRNGFGYGVTLYRQAEVEIYRNMFNFDRHAIAADGSPGSSYSAHDNIHMGTAIYHIFDAHGGSDRGDGTDIACDKVEMVNNVFLSDKLPYKKRGTPTEHSLFTKNIVIYPENSYQYRFLYGNNFICEDNIFGIAQPVKKEYSFEGGTSYPLPTDDVKIYKDMEYIDSKTHALRYAYILVFTPKDDGYYISEYGNNLDDGSIRNWNEKVYVPEGGFVVTFKSDNGSWRRLYDAVSARHGVIYNTTLMLDGDFIAKYDGELLRVTASKK